MTRLRRLASLQAGCWDTVENKSGQSEAAEVHKSVRHAELRWRRQVTPSSGANRPMRAGLTFDR
jgi:hypothetical protein